MYYFRRLLLSAIIAFMGSDAVSAIGPVEATPLKAGFADGHITPKITKEKPVWIAGYMLETAGRSGRLDGLVAVPLDGKSLQVAARGWLCRWKQRSARVDSTALAVCLLPCHLALTGDRNRKTGTMQRLDFHDRSPS